MTAPELEAEMNQAFLIVMNRLPQDRKAYCDACEREIMPMIGDTSILESKLVSLSKELEDLYEQLERLILTNSTTQQNQAIYAEKYDQLNNQISQREAMMSDLEKQIADIRIRKENARIYLEGLRSIESGTILTKFDVQLWHSVVEYAKVMTDGTIVFRFRNGNEDSVKLREAQKAL